MDERRSSSEGPSRAFTPEGGSAVFIGCGGAAAAFWPSVCSAGRSPAAPRQELILRERLHADADHGLTEVLGELGEGGGVIVVPDGLDDSPGAARPGRPPAALIGLTGGGLENAGAHEHAVDA